MYIPEYQNGRKREYEVKIECSDMKVENGVISLVDYQYS